MLGLDLVEVDVHQLLAAQPGREQHVDDRPIAQRPPRRPDPELLGRLGPAAASQLVEPLEAIAEILQRADLLRREGPRLERRQAQLADPLGRIADGEEVRGLGAGPRSVKAESEARWLLTVAGARP